MVHVHRLVKKKKKKKSKKKIYKIKKTILQIHFTVEKSPHPRLSHFLSVATIAATENLWENLQKNHYSWMFLNLTG